MGWALFGIGWIISGLLAYGIDYNDLFYWRKRLKIAQVALNSPDRKELNRLHYRLDLDSELRESEKYLGYLPIALAIFFGFIGLASILIYYFWNARKSPFGLRYQMPQHLRAAKPEGFPLQITNDRSK